MENETQMISDYPSYYSSDQYSKVLPDSMRPYEIKMLDKLGNIAGGGNQRAKNLRLSGIKNIRYKTLKKADLFKILCEFNHTCAYCGFPFVVDHDQIEFDHVVPLHLGGEHKLRNLIPACRYCNNNKGAIHPKQWFKSKNISAIRIDKIRQHWKNYS